MEVKELLQKHTLKCLTGGFVVGLMFAGFMSVMSEVSGSPAFCGTCHTMKEEAASFAEASHRYQECTDCHLPHDNVVSYWIAKGTTGMNDTYHEVMRDYPAHIKLSADGRKTVNDNCLRCHEGTMERVHTAFDDADTDCLKCHSRIAHGSNHLEGGIKVE